MSDSILTSAANDKVYLVHHGIKGQKWGVRRFQNYDGSLTIVGKERYARENNTEKRKKELLAKGFSESAAKRQIDFENRAALVAGVCAAAIGASVVYGLVRAHNGDNDLLLNAGSELFRVASSDSTQLNDMFYAATNKLDATKYAGVYAKQKLNPFIGDPSSDIYQKVISPNVDIKVAGSKTGKKIFKELCNSDPAFNYAFGDDGYDEFNRYITVNKNQGQTKKFFDALQSKGYGGIMDVNDIKYSGYQSNKPVIFFNQQNSMSVNSVRKLSDVEINRNAAIGAAAMAGQSIMSKPVTVAAATTAAGLTYMNSYQDNQINRQVKQQRRK